MPSVSWVLTSDDEMLGAGSPLSAAVAIPVLVGLLSSSTSIVRSAGAFKTGAVVSTTEIVWSLLAALPAASVAVQVRVMT